MLWHFEYFKLEESEKQQVQEELSDQPPSAWKQVVRPSGERCSTYTWRKGASLSLKMEGLKRNPNILGLLNFSYFTTLAHTLLSSIFSHNFLLFIKPSRKRLRFYHFFRSSFPMKASVSYKIYIIYIYALLLLISLLSVQYTRPQAENLRQVEGKMFFCLYLKFLNNFSVLLPSP